MTDRPAGRVAPRLEIARAEEGHAESVAEFFRQVWDPQATPESVIAARREAAALNVAEPGTPPPTWIALQQGKCLGYVTTIPVRLWDGAHEWPAYLIKGLMVLPEFRSGPIGYLVLKAAVACLPRTGALAVAAPARRLFEALGYADLGAVPNWIRPLAPHRILQRLDLARVGLPGLPRWIGPAIDWARKSGLGTAIGWAGGAALRATAAAGRLPTLGLAVDRFAPQSAADELDILWRSARGGYFSAVTRDANYLLKRYPCTSDGAYIWLAARRHDQLAGVAILRRPSAAGDERLQGIRLATLADIVYDPAHRPGGLALLGGAEGLALSIGADAIVASASAPQLASLLRRQCYLPLSGNVHFLFRDVAGDGPTFGKSLPGWWISRGDGQADEVF
jgi:GNAT superfamily N-acetyltransferase